MIRKKKNKESEDAKFSKETAEVRLPYRVLEDLEHPKGTKRKAGEHIGLTEKELASFKGGLIEQVKPVVKEVEVTKGLLKVTPELAEQGLEEGDTFDMHIYDANILEEIGVDVKAFEKSYTHVRTAAERKEEKKKKRAKVQKQLKRKARKAKKGE